MSKYQDALLTLVTNSSQFFKENKLEGSQFMEWHNKSRDLLQELVDKETPMKPIRYNTNQYKCPKCLNQIKGQKWLYNMETKRFDIKSKIKVEKVYCPYCGQKLDWSDECEKKD